MGDSIRERRERIGISQRKFAEILGISREHLNRIEAGERKPSKNLLEKIELHSGVYNPEAEVDIMLDYVRIRFRTTDYERILREVIKIRIQYMVREKYAFYGYSAQYVYGDITLMISADENMGCLLELKGKGCRLFESLLLAQRCTWCDFLRLALNSGGVIKRIDLAVNDRVGLIDVTWMMEKLEKREYMSVFHRYDFYRSGILTREQDGIEDVVGNTIYIGSKKSDIYFCIYEKDYEQYVKNNISMEEAEIRNRFEIRLKDERAEKAIEDLLEYEDVGRTAFGIINRYLVFLVPEVDKARRFWRIDPKWERFVGQENRCLRLTMKPEHCDTLEDKINWITRQCAPTLKAIRMYDASIGEVDRIEGIIDAAHISSQMEKIINAALLDMDEIIEKGEIE